MIIQWSFDEFSNLFLQMRCFLSNKCICGLHYQHGFQDLHNSCSRIEKILISEVKTSSVYIFYCLAKVTRHCSSHSAVDRRILHATVSVGTHQDVQHNKFVLFIHTRTHRHIAFTTSLKKPKGYLLTQGEKKYIKRKLCYLNNLG